MITVHTNSANDKTDTPVICPICNRGKLVNTQAMSKVVRIRRNMLPSKKRGVCLQVKCPKCDNLLSLTITC